MKIAATWKWVALALAGLLIAGAVAVAASRLASEQIGIVSESVSAGDQLAPVVRQAANQTNPSPKPQQQRPAEPEPEPTTTTESDDHGGDDSGSDDHGGDDHGGEDHSGHGGGGDD